MTIVEQTPGSFSEYLAFRTDFDHDGLCDAWEVAGIDVPGRPDNLPLPGASPTRRDIFLEIDAMQGRAPLQFALDDVVTAFTTAPNGGIALHPFLDETQLPRQPLPLHFWASDFDPMKDAHFGTAQERSDPQWIAAKAQAYRYCLFADTITRSTQGQQTGKAKNIVCRDFVVALGSAMFNRAPVPGGTRDQQSAALMHELGHALGLHHGGRDDLNHKPNYRSVMNYLWTFPSSTQSRLRWHLQYATVLTNTLNEFSLDEYLGIGGLPGDSVLIPTRAWQQRRPNRLRVVPEAGPVDWNQDGNVRSQQSWQFVDHDPAHSVLTPYLDWSIVVLDSVSNDTLAAAASAYDEVTFEDVDAIEGVFCDCNGNGRADYRDILSGTSWDLDLNGLPDECQRQRVTFRMPRIRPCPAGDADSLAFDVDLGGLCAYDTAATQLPLLARPYWIDSPGPVFWDASVPAESLVGVLVDDTHAHFATASISGCGRIRVDIYAGQQFLCRSDTCDVRSFDLNALSAGTVDRFDYTAMQAAMGSGGGSCADADWSGVVNGMDLAYFLAHYWSSAPHHVVRRVLTPNGGETINTSSNVNIAWRRGFGDSSRVTITLLRDSQPSTRIAIVGNYLDGGSYLWSVPAGLITAGDYRVEVVHTAGIWRSGDQPTGADTSDAPFTIQTPENGGCPLVETLTSDGWLVENTILGRSLDGSLLTDAYRLTRTPSATDGVYRLRVRENETETTRLDRVALLVVDHVPEMHAYAMNGRVLLGSSIAARNVTRQDGTDITARITATGGDGYTGVAGETLLVEMPSNAQENGVKDLDPVIIDPGDKGGGGGLVADGHGLESRDATVLASAGIAIQGRDDKGVWRTVRKIYPRERFDEMLVDTLDQGPLRLVFLGRHKVRFVGRVIPAVTQRDGLSLPMMKAEHTRSGNVLNAIKDADGTTVTLARGDTIAMEFAAPPIGSGLVRSVFLVARGAYTSGVSQPEGRIVLPGRYELLQNRPNPFSHATAIGFALPRASHVKIEVYDLAGRMVAMPGDGVYSAGVWTVEWDGRDMAGRALPATMYFYRMTAGTFRAQKKLVILP
jgi:hypothetical protein